ncbi:polymorphic toxin type 46 domain-containing protein [Dyadobacter sp. CY107]|uniref:RHS repeat-associated core domain-containing protein n=1 Tax=Dyadobacter fanqingshengii TaxID=2906443 RepID=UPI001F230BD7|nr:RHS repeat-associated core domain-containing protein [Dyadobacter fanqingshengii]MCF2502424.1 polymorphic toxin type 46 domain-containing protein [Dyadobacter fanqingshengii]
MFVIKSSQLDAFKVPFRKKKREEILIGLISRNKEGIYEEGRNIIIENDRGALSKINFSESFQLESAIKASGAGIHFQFDDQDRPTRFELPNRESLAIDYKNDLPFRITINEGSLELIYNDSQQITSIIFPDNLSVGFDYDENHKVVAITNRAGETQKYSTFIKGDRLVHNIKNPLGCVTRMEMDQYGGVENVIFPDNSVISSSFDEELDAEIVRLRNGRKKEVYSGDIFVENIEWEDGAYRSVDINESNQIKVITNSSGEIKYEYDGDRLLSESFNNSKIVYAYEDDLIKEVLYPSGLRVVYSYSDDDELCAVNFNNQKIEYEYDYSGNLDRIIYPNGLVENQKNFHFSGIQQSRTTKNGDIIATRTYSYDSLGRLRIYDVNSSKLIQNLRFDYDNADRLILADDLVSDHYENFEYDINGNIIIAGSEKILLGEMDEIRSINGNPLQYDLNGNLLGYQDRNRGDLLFTYADDGTLVTAKVNDELWEYAYDALGRRVEKTNSQEQFRYCWSGENLISEEYKSHNTTVVRDYVYAEGNVPIAFVEDGNTFLMQKDVRGAVVEVFNSNGQSVWSASYTSFGEAVILDSQIRQPWRLSGHYYDEETGLHYNIARYYSPRLRSYLSLDPKWLLFGATNYSYAANDPYNKLDSDGNLPEWVNTANILSFAAGIVAGTVAAGATAAAGTAIAGAVGLSASAIAIAAGSIVAVAAIGALSGAVGGFIESIVKDKLEGKCICWECAKEATKSGAAFGLVLGPIGKVTGRVASSALSKYSPKFMQITLVRRLRMSFLKRIRIFQRAKRRDIAREFYIKNGMPPDRVDSHLNGINFSKPVRVEEIPAGTKLFQFKKEKIVEDNEGNRYAVKYVGKYYATNPNAKPTDLGISEKYVMWEEVERDLLKRTSAIGTDIRNVEIEVVLIKNPTIGLKTTAKAVADSWSMKGELISKIQTVGGAEQIYIPNNF